MEDAEGVIKVGPVTEVSPNESFWKTIVNHPQTQSDTSAVGIATVPSVNNWAKHSDWPNGLRMSGSTNLRWQYFATQRETGKNRQ